MGMCRWMRLHFYDWIDYNGRFNRVTRMGSHIFDLDLGDKKVPVIRDFKP